VTFAETLVTDSGKVPVDGWPQVDLAIRALDGSGRSTVLLMGHGRQFAVAGGSNGNYLCWWSDKEDRIFDLRRSGPPISGDQVSLVVGGLEAWFEPAQLVDLSIALTAACEFVLSGARAQGLTWQRKVRTRRGSR